MVYPYPTDKPLPELPVVREDFCSQDMTDNIIAYFAKQRPDLIEELYEKCLGLSGDYFTSFSKVAEFAHSEASKVMDVPQDPRGYIDLTFELCRRLRTNMEIPPFEVVGNPIAPDISGPFMPLAAKEARIYTLELGFTQAGLNELLEQYYKDKPDYWYLTGEGLRRAQGVYIPKISPSTHDATETYLRELNMYLDEIARRQIKAKKNDWQLAHTLKIEATDRLRIMCNIPSGR